MIRLYMYEKDNCRQNCRFLEENKDKKKYFMSLPYRKQEKKRDWKYHFDVRPRHEPYEAHYAQLKDLETSELVNLPLGHPSNIMVGRIRRLFVKGQRKTESNNYSLK